jgi:NTP pyrophosphatase (non-canonical NTP hydrolase)
MGHITDMRISSDELGREVTNEEVIAAVNVTSAYIGEWARGKGFRDTEDYIAWLDHLGDELVRLSDKAYGLSPEAREVNPDAPRGLENHRLMAAMLRKEIIPHLRLLEAGNKHMLIVSEIAEMHENLREHGHEEDDNYGEEIADSIIRLLDRAQAARVRNLGFMLVEKLKSNAKRPHKHGKKF